MGKSTVLVIPSNKEKSTLMVFLVWESQPYCLFLHEKISFIDSYGIGKLILVVFLYIGRTTFLMDMVLKLYISGSPGVGKSTISVLLMKERNGFQVY